MKLTVGHHKELASRYVEVLARCAHFGSEPPSVSDHLQGFFDRGDYVNDDIEAVEELLLTAAITVTWPEGAALTPADASQVCPICAEVIVGSALALEFHALNAHAVPVAADAGQA